MDFDDDDKLAPLRADLTEVLEKHSELLKPLDDDEDVMLAAEMGMTYVSGWVLTIGVSSVENRGAPSISTRVTPLGQNPHLGIGLLYDTLRSWVG